MRLTKDARREQLLDSAAELLLERPSALLTMEGLGAAAGVSKAVPYLHFGNSDDVLAALYEREVGRMAERIGTAIEGRNAEDRVAAAIGAYLDVVGERGAILAVLPRPASDAQSATSFVTDLLRDAFDLPPGDARVAAAALYGALGGLVDAWARRQASRRTVERLAIDLAMHLGRSLAPTGG